MAAYSTNANVQTNRFQQVRGRAQPGERPAGNAYTHRPVSGVDSTENVAQETEITFTAAAAIDSPTITIDGAPYVFASGATTTLAAAGAETALQAQLDDENSLLSQVLESVSADAAVLTLVFKDYAAHTVEYTADGTTTATVADSVDASAEVNHKAGVFVAVDTASGDPSIFAVRKPSSASDMILGVTEASPYPTQQTPPNQYGLAEGEAWPTHTAMQIAQDGLICVRIRANVSAGDPVYAYAEAGSSTAGYATNSESLSAGAHQVTQGDVEYSGTDAVGLVVDGYLVSVASNASDDQTVEDLRDAWNNDAYAASIATATMDTSGSESLIILTFIDYAEHIVVAYSPATADVTSITNTTEAVAQAAQAVRYKNAKFWETRTAVQGDAYVELG